MWFCFLYLPTDRPSPVWSNHLSWTNHSIIIVNVITTVMLTCIIIGSVYNCKRRQFNLEKHVHVWTSQLLYSMWYTLWVWWKTDFNMCYLARYMERDISISLIDCSSVLTCSRSCSSPQSWRTSQSLEILPLKWCLWRETIHGRILLLDWHTLLLVTCWWLDADHTDLKPRHGTNRKTRVKFWFNFRCMIWIVDL